MPKTINNHSTVLRAVLKAAVKWRLLRDGPSVKLLRMMQKDVVFLDFAEAKALIEAVQGIYGYIVELATNSGLRIGRLLAI